MTLLSCTLMAMKNLTTELLKVEGGIEITSAMISCNQGSVVSATKTEFLTTMRALKPCTSRTGLETTLKILDLSKSLPSIEKTVLSWNGVPRKEIEEGRDSSLIKT